MGNLKFGNNAPLALYMGVSGATKAYYGTEVVFGGEPTPIDYSKEYLTMEILTGGTINWKEVGGSTVRAELSYSLNDGNWTALPTGSTINVSAGDKVRFKGNNPTYSNSSSTGAGCTFSGSTASFNLYGNIMSLIYGDDFEGQTSISSEYTFKNMFAATSVVDAENLVLVSGGVKRQSYARMFYNCKSLVNAPLEILSVADSVCSKMFYGCTALVTAPSLPATSLKETCYEYMFSGCSSLTTAPALPATGLNGGCYQYMFKGCTSLTTAPALPAAWRVSRLCYFHMFDGCTSLTTAPALPVATMNVNCYAYMFNGCTSLTSAPALPAMTLADYCYQYMFNGCTSLTAAPELPATTLATSCYQQMFNGCTSLNYVKCLATNISAKNCLSNSLAGVSSSGTFEGYSSAGYPSGASGIPEGWTFVEAT